MIIDIEKRAIVFKLKDDCINLKALEYFIQSSFKNIKSFSNLTVILDNKDELAKKRYLLKWAYKIYLKKENLNASIDFKKITASMHLPIHIIRIDKKAVAKSLKITINHTGSNKLRVNCSQYYFQVIKHFKMVFKDSMISSVDKRVFTLTLHKKSDLILLKSILSRKRISNISVVFSTHGLNFNRLNTQEAFSEEMAYREKLKKSYKILSITNSSTSKEIKNNYKKMLRKYHPDRVSTQDSETVKLYTRRFQVIQEAYMLIKEHQNKVA